MLDGGEPGKLGKGEGELIGKRVEVRIGEI